MLSGVGGQMRLTFRKRYRLHLFYHFMRLYSIII